MFECSPISYVFKIFWYHRRRGFLQTYTTSYDLRQEKRIQPCPRICERVRPRNGEQVSSNPTKGTRISTTMIFGQVNCEDIPDAVQTDGGVAGAGVRLSISHHAI